MIGKILLAIDSRIILLMAIGVVLQFLISGKSAEERSKIFFKIYHPLIFGGIFYIFAWIFSLENSIEAMIILYPAILLSFLLNWRVVGLNALFLGMNLNRLVVIANGGKMPVLLAEGVGDRHIAMNSETLLPFLSDWILIKGYQMSIGDILMYAGAFLFVSYQIYLCAKIVWGKMYGN